MRLQLKHSLYFRLVLITLSEAALISLALTSAFLLRFDFAIPVSYTGVLARALLVALTVKLTAFHLARLHQSAWRYVTILDMSRLGIVNGLASLALGAICTVWIGRTFPRSIYGIDFLVCQLLTAFLLVSVRLREEMSFRKYADVSRKGVLIYGAGRAGAGLVREFRAMPKLGHVVGFLDDDPMKINTRIAGVPVLGRGRDATALVDRYRTHTSKIEEIVIAMPSATSRQMREAAANCAAAGVPCKTVPGLAELLNGRVLSSQLRNISLNDLLGRASIRLDEPKIRKSIAGHCVMVTGAAGSIGSEICRQVGKFQPARLVAFDWAESELYKIELELRQDFPGLDLVVAIGDIKDEVRVSEVIRANAVDSIFHAAAYKHVPLMESHVLEAVKNNILGTWRVSRAAAVNHVSSFVLISSDKAVNPTNLMGATKRVAEVMVSALNQIGATRFVAVRFGNVLGSNGSVVPIFRGQIAAGGPVTVTHPEMRRYFMTIPEAVLLVLEASTLGKGSEIFVLDMGAPVRVVDLAQNMIRLTGLVPDEDIEIRYVGLRPGEKLFEELKMDGEDMLPTPHEKIKVFRGQPMNIEQIESWLDDLEQLTEQRDELRIVAHVRAIVPEYSPSPALARGKAKRASAAHFGGPAF
jgi:FlaA1/EpsC-like NDP-sugar epimerase